MVPEVSSIRSTRTASVIYLECVIARQAHDTVDTSGSGIARIMVSAKREWLFGRAAIGTDRVTAPGLVAPWKLEGEATRRSADKVVAIGVSASSSSHPFDWLVNRSSCTVQWTVDLDVCAPYVILVSDSDTRFLGHR
jgi:hypothetical protein